MTHGRKVCNTLKEIRQQIADKNEIEYSTSECHFEGECIGTCPKCESEVKYLENELHRRRQLGKAVAVAGISLGMVGTFAGCGTPKQKSADIPEQEVTIEKMEVADTTEELILTTMGYFAPEIVDVDATGEITIADTIKAPPPLLMGVAPPIDSLEKDY